MRPKGQPRVWSKYVRKLMRGEKRKVKPIKTMPSKSQRNG